MKQLYKEINKDEFSNEIPVSYNQAQIKVITKQQYSPNQTEQVLLINKDILDKDKKKQHDNYVDLQISRSLVDITRSRSSTQSSVASALPNVEIRQSHLHQISQPQIAKRYLHKSGSKLIHSLSNSARTSVYEQ
ncbi:Hypothetical_protein [Hexamita inflata]|uniref:Hypothetical_protein n=1 Tax=Hexamita inflata TaxID=28002 RepID=A0AA86T978_9EUKA|nr:Hypothetical protein HINF_LOCUS434 [Hexamita inflata]